MQSRSDIVDEEGSRKRGLPSEPTDGLDNAKRARLDAETPPLIKIPPLPPGRLSFAQLYTLTEDAGLSSFDVKQLPPDLVVKIAIPILARIDQSAFSQAIDVGYSAPGLLSPLTPLGNARSIPNVQQAASRAATSR